MEIDFRDVKIDLHMYIKIAFSYNVNEYTIDYINLILSTKIDFHFLKF